MTSTKYKNLSATETIALTLRVALEHHDRGQLREAAALYQEVLGMDSSNADALYLLGLLQVKLGNQHVAVQLLRAAVHARPEAAHMHRSLAEALLRAGRTAAALHCYWRILAIEPANPLAFVDVGDTLVTIKPEGGNDTAAASCYRRALVLNPQCGTAHLGLGLIQQRNGDTVNAESGMRAAIAMDGRVSRFHAALATLLLEQEQYASAADSYRRAIALQPASPVLLDKLGDALGHMGQKLRAQACYDRAVELRSATERGSSKRASVQHGESSFSPVAIPWAGDAVPLAVTLRNMRGNSSSRGMPVQ
jgi:tetratricopeptide (TPR) repeat protein